MIKVRDRLIELLESGYYEALSKCKGDNKDKKLCEFLSDFLLANGVKMLPVKAGDKIYEICERRKSKEWVKTISERFVHGVEICADNCMIIRCGTTISVFLSDIGKTVFLSREEAEKVLAERNGKE